MTPVTAPRRRPPAWRALVPAGLALLTLGLAACGGGTTGRPAASPATTTTPATGTPAASTPATGPTGSTSASPTAAGTPSLPAVLPATSCRLRVDAMTPTERAGELVMVGHQVGSDPAATGRLVAAQHLGSVILMGNTTGGVHGVRAMTDAIRAAAGPAGGGLLVTVDQEGGQVKRLSGDGFSPMPAAAVQGTWSAATLTAAARSWGQEMRAAGIDVDLAPVADVVPADRVAVNEPIAKWGRGFGSDPSAVSAHVGAFVTGLRSGGTGTAVKHFPGLGQVVGNTDFATDVVDDRTTRHDPLLEPFAAGIGAGTDMVMVSSARYTRIDAANPALWSSTVISGMLRGDLGWQGVVASDDLGVAAQVRSVAPGERAVRFIEAGGDIAVTVDPSLAADMAAGIAAAAEQDPAFDRKVRASALRVLDLKAQRHLSGCTAD